MGWLVAVCSTLGIAVWEILTDEHLSMSKQETGLVMNYAGETINRQFASVTFGNYNSYVTFLCFALPFLFYHMLVAAKLSLKSMLSILAIILSVVCVLINASRGGLITASVMLVIYVSFSISKRRIMPYVFLLILISAYGVYKYGNVLLAAAGLRTMDGYLLSGETRYPIWMNALRAFYDSSGFGVGIGSMTKAMEKYTNGITSAHNMMLEILLQYGFAFFVIILVFIAFLFYKSFKQTIMEVRLVLLMSLVTFPIYSIIDSNYLLKVPTFVLMASLVVFVNYERIKFLR
jgi:O-antigen ligase